MSFKASIVGTKAFTRRIKDFSKEAVEVVDTELSAGALKSASVAKRLAPVDEGILRNSIGADVTKFLQKEFFAGAFWAPYIEFGTGSKVNIPATYEQFAAEFKGKANRGNIQQFFYKMVQWVLRKGITGTYSVKTQRRQRISRSETDRAYQIAYAIMIKILKEGIRPQPFFIPAFKQVSPEVARNIVKQIKRKVK